MLENKNILDIRVGEFIFAEQGDKYVLIGEVIERLGPLMFKVQPRYGEAFTRTIFSDTMPVFSGLREDALRADDYGQLLAENGEPVTVWSAADGPSYTRTARVEDGKLVLTPFPFEGQVFRVAVCRNNNGDEWLEVLQPGQTHDCESYTWAVASTLEGAREAHEDWF